MLFKTALGIETGMLVASSCSHLVHVVTDIVGPRYYDHWNDHAEWIVRAWPVVNLVMKEAGKPLATNSYMGAIRREPDGRYFSDMNDEIWFAPGPPMAQEMDLFLSYPPEPPQFVFQPGVDYSPSAPTWRCSACGRDFNLAPPPGVPHLKSTTCIHCGSWDAHRVFVMRPRVIGMVQSSAYTVALNCEDPPPLRPWGPRKNEAPPWAATE